MEESKKFPTVRDFIEAVDRAVFQNELGHSTQVVTRAIAEDKMPGHWFLDVRDFCEKHNHQTPEHLFKRARKSPRPATQFVNGGGELQAQQRKSAENGRAEAS